MGNIAPFCPKCGAKTMEGDVFCGKCGANLTETAAPAAAPVSTQAAAAPVSAPPAAAPVSAPPAASAYHAGQPAGSPQPNLNPAAAGQTEVPGKGHATASLVLGIIAVVCWFFGYSAIISVVCGGIGLYLAGKAKEEGFEGSTRTAGFVLSLIGLIGGGLIFIACVACVGSLGLAGCSSYY